MPAAAARVGSSRVLMVGAGGIGCELLKNLVLSGFTDIHLLDLDTIDLSNLNRQFLFRSHHIKKSKALTARETAGEFNPNARLTAIHANIKDPQFDVQWFRSFDLVFNALDNIDARRHVNRMCLVADTPLIESGTTGYRGQVQVISGGRTECYDCNPKEVPKSFPICTIRSTPSQPIHCIVWAKSYLFAQVFGVDEDAGELDAAADAQADNADEIDNLRREASALAVIRQSMGTPDFARLVFDKVFCDDVGRLRSMKDMWKHRAAPKAIRYDSVNRDDDAEPWRHDQSVWSLEDNVRVFSDSLSRLSQRMAVLRDGLRDGDTAPTLEFDKDDEDTLDFVAAASNIRAHIFGIEQKSKFDVKQMAGNIIAAIATTNAIVAAVCVLQAFKLLGSGGDVAGTKTVFLSRRPERVFNNEASAAPNPGCEVCGVARGVLHCDTSTATLGNLVDALRAKHGYGEEMSILTSSLVYDADFDDNVDSFLAEMSIGPGVFVTVVDDEDDNTRVNLVLLVQARAGDQLEIDVPAGIPSRVKGAPAAEQDTIVAAPEAVVAMSASAVPEKRKRALSTTDAEDSKKTRLDATADDILVIDEDDTIVIE